MSEENERRKRRGEGKMGGREWSEEGEGVCGKVKYEVMKKKHRRCGGEVRSGMRLRFGGGLES